MLRRALFSFGVDGKTAAFFAQTGCNPEGAVIECVAYDIISEGVIETNNHLGHSVKKLHFLMDQTMNRKLQELDLTSAQGHVIGFLRHHRERPCARDLETAYGLSHATVSGILSRMESKGFIELRPDPADRRIKRISLLDKGTACSESIRRHIRESEGIMAQGFTEQELEQFRGYLHRAIANLEQSIRENHCNREE